MQYLEEKSNWYLYIEEQASLKVSIRRLREFDALVIAVIRRRWIILRYTENSSIIINHKSRLEDLLEDSIFSDKEIDSDKGFPK